MYDPRSRHPNDLRRVPRPREGAVVVWIAGVVVAGIIAALIALIVVLLR